MKLDRRDVIKGLVLTGLSGVIPGRIAAGMVNAGERLGIGPQTAAVHVLVGGSSQDAAFLAGARDAARQLGVKWSVLHLERPLCEEIAQLEDLLQTRQTVAALLGPSDGALLEQLARGSGLRRSFLGHHILGGSGSPSRHHLTTVAQSAGLGACLLDGCSEQNISVTETHLGAKAEASQPIAGFTAGSELPWAALLGSCMVQVACESRGAVVSDRKTFSSRWEREAGRPENLTSMLIQG